MSWSFSAEKALKHKGFSHYYSHRHSHDRRNRLLQLGWLNSNYISDTILSEPYEMTAIVSILQIQELSSHYPNSQSYVELEFKFRYVSLEKRRGLESFPEHKYWHFSYSSTVFSIQVVKTSGTSTVRFFSLCLPRNELKIFHTTIFVLIFCHILECFILMVSPLLITLLSS